MSIPDEIRKLEDLYEAGSLTDDEFFQAKQRILDGASVESGRIQGIDEKMWCTLMHLSQLLTYSGLGVIAPIVMWLMSKDESRLARIHGIHMINWMISCFIYVVVSALLSAVLIGIPFLIVFGLLSVIFPIVAAIKANNNEIWEYPMSIKFLSVN